MVFFKMKLKCVVLVKCYDFYLCVVWFNFELFDDVFNKIYLFVKIRFLNISGGI